MALRPAVRLPRVFEGPASALRTPGLVPSHLREPLASGSNGRRQKPNKRISQDCVGDGQADGQCELVVVEFRPQEQRGKA